MILPERLHPWLVFCVALLLCTSFISCYPIYILDEARNAEAAREMLFSGDYLIPRFNGELRTDKPPLHYYFMIFGYELFGVNRFGARFFSGVFGALTALITFLSVRKWLGLKTAFLTILIILSALFFVQEFHLAVPDPYLIFFVTASLLSFFEIYKNPTTKWYVLAYGSIGLGLLTKGPVAIVLPSLTVLVFLVLNGSFSLFIIRRFMPVAGLITAICLAFPWYYLVHEATQGEWTQGFFLDHNINRFNSGKEGHGGFFLLTPLFVILGLLPFSCVLLQSAVEGWKLRKQNDLLLFTFSSALVTLLFFSIASTKLPNYPMPAYPLISILIAAYLNRMESSYLKLKTIKWSLLFLIFVSFLVALGGYLALHFTKQLHPLRWYSLLLLPLPFASVFSWIYFKKQLLRMSLLVVAGGWMLTGLFLFGIIYPKLIEKSPVQVAKRIMPKDASIVVFQRFDSAFPFNYQRTFPVVQTFSELDDFLLNNPDAFILTNTRNKQTLKSLGSYSLVLEHPALFENNITRIYKK